MGCEWLLTNCYLYPGTKWFIGREELTRLKSTTLLTWYKVCKHHKIPPEDWKYNGQDHYIEFVRGIAAGSRIDLLDLKYLPTDPLYERYGSSEYTGGWIEEAGEVNFGAFDVLKSRVGRWMNDKYKLLGKLLVTANPKKNWIYQYFYKPWIEGGKLETWKDALGFGYAFVQSLVGDNPYREAESERSLQSLTDPVQKQRLLFGNWEYDDDPYSLMSYANISDLFTNTLTGDKTVAMVCDVARFGQDTTVITIWRGLEVVKIEQNSKQSTLQTIALLKQFAIDYQIPYSRIVVDEDGVGGGVVDGMMGIVGFVGNRTPNPDLYGNKANYRNLRSQCYYMLAEQVNTHQMAIRCNDPEMQAEIIQELEQIKAVNADKDATMQIIAKDEIKLVIGRSPDFSDALMMRMILEIDSTPQPAGFVNAQNNSLDEIGNRYGLFNEV